MSPRTVTAPPTDRAMWRRLLRVGHPDVGGDGDLFVWCRNLQEYVAGDSVEPPQRSYHQPRHERGQPARAL